MPKQNINPIYKYPDLYAAPVGMAPIVGNDAPKSPAPNKEPAKLPKLPAPSESSAQSAPNAALPLPVSALPPLPVSKPDMALNPVSPPVSEEKEEKADHSFAVPTLSFSSSAPSLPTSESLPEAINPAAGIAEQDDRIKAPLPLPKPVVTAQQDAPPPAQSLTQAPTPTLTTASTQTTEQTAVHSPAPTPAPLTVPVQTFAEKRVIFRKGSSDLDPVEQAILDRDIVPYLRENPDVTVTIKAFASAQAEQIAGARRMALSRALMTREYLIVRGVASSRIDVTVLGSETDIEPKDRVDFTFNRA